MSVASLASLAAFVLRAAAPGETPPTPEVKKLERFIGAWKASESVDIIKSKITSTFTCNRMAAGWAMECKVVTKGMPGQGSYDMVGLLGWNQWDTSVHFYAVSNTGECFDYKGSWVDEDTLTVEYRGYKGGKPFYEKMTAKFPAAREMRITTSALLDGHPADGKDATYHK